MTDSFLDNAGGYTPVPDKLVREYDYTTAYVWGKVWRYCQMQSGACTASHETIANRAGMSRRTLIEKLNILIKDGYIEDLTPNLKNKPHTYCTKKGEAKITSAMQISHTESDNPTEINKDLDSESDVSMRTLHSDDADNAQSDTPTMQNLHSSYAEIAQPTMQNLHLKKDSLETLKDTKSKKEKIPPKGGGKPPGVSQTQQESRAMFSALAQVCGYDIKLLTEETRGALNQAEKLMRENGYKPADLVAFGEWWHSHDWRGKQGDAPNLTQIRETWGRFRKRQQSNGPPPDPIPPPDLPEHVSVWERAKPILRSSLGYAAFEANFKDAQPVKPDRSNGTFILMVKASALEMIEAKKNLKATILTAFQTVKPEIHDVQYDELKL